MKQKNYIDRVHTWGRISAVTGLCVMLAVPLSMSVYFDAWPQAQLIFRGLLGVIPLFYTTAVVEVLTYSPMLGAGGTYLSFITGNISNLKLPCGLNAMENAGVRANSQEGEVISTIAIAASSITTTLILALGILLFAPILPRLTAPDSVFAPAFRQVIPALFGALGAGYFAKHWRISVLPILAGVLLLVFAPTMQVGLLLFITVVVSLLGAHLFYKRKLV